jgi:hypothetical protein
MSYHWTSSIDYQYQNSKHTIVNKSVHPVFGTKLCRIQDTEQIKKLIATGKRGVQQVCSGGDLYTAMSGAKMASVRGAGGYVNLLAPSTMPIQPAAADGEGAAADGEGAAAEGEGVAVGEDDEGDEGLGADAGVGAPFQLQHDHPGCCQSEMFL